MKRESSADSAARFLAMRGNRTPRYVAPREPRRLAAKPEAHAARRVTGKLDGLLSQRTYGSITEALGEPLSTMLGFTTPQPGDRINVDFARATLEEIHRRLCDVILRGDEYEITRIAERLVRSALGKHGHPTPVSGEIESRR